MARVKFPHRVKYHGVYYAPGAVIETASPEDAVASGAELLPEDRETATTPEPDAVKPAAKRGSRAKKTTTKE